MTAAGYYGLVDTGLRIAYCRLPIAKSFGDDNNVGRIAHDATTDLFPTNQPTNQPSLNTSLTCHTMRLFKRHMSDPSPQLVSAVAISQDADTASDNIVEDNGKSMKKSKPNTIDHGSEVANSECPKPKRIHRMESLRNFFKSATGDHFHFHQSKSSVVKTATIQEEEVVLQPLMEKALSEGTVTTVYSKNHDNYECAHIDREAAFLREKKTQLSSSTRDIEGLRGKKRLLDYILQHEEIPKTQRDDTFALRETLRRRKRSVHTDADAPVFAEDVQKTRIFNFQLASISRGANGKETPKETPPPRLVPSTRASSSALNGLEDFLSNLRLGCDESGYDSDSTRAGADSPDSEKSAIHVPPAILSDDYHGVDLSLADLSTLQTDASVPPMTGTCVRSRIEKVDKRDDATTTSNNGVSFNESSGNQSTANRTSEVDGDDDTDSCDEDTFADLVEYQPADTLLARHYSKEQTRTAPRLCDPSSSTPSAAETRGPSACSPRGDTSDDDDDDDDGDDDDGDGDGGGGGVDVPCRDKSRASVVEALTSERRLGATVENRVVSVPYAVKLQALSLKDKRSKSRKCASPSVQRLLVHAESLCQDSPPASKICPPSATPSSGSPRCYNPKRLHSSLESEDNASPEVTRSVAKKLSTTSSVDKQQSATTASSATKNLVRRELRTMKLTVNRATGLGISVERCEAARPYYVIAKMDPDGEAARSRQFRVGDEIVRVCGRRIRGMSMAEARNAVRSCLGNVELQIAREPSVAFGADEIGDTWGDASVRLRGQDFDEAWISKNIRATAPREDHPATIASDRRDATATRREDDSSETRPRTSPPQKVTGMKKFQIVRKRSDTLPVRRASNLSLSVDLLTVVLQKGAQKKLGFTIVGGVDSNKGRMGIFRLTLGTSTYKKML
ncbi:Multiple PDZ domain protein [Harpegnathos saltator]|uniref:Multiple PDZ domain protein n=1 Tax=Harpegnathos saltator TaxID=610380 RepID=E2BWZ4_HARSA|nr:Multiple PDZ domain protein [Harpegnathos saltator]